MCLLLSKHSPKCRSNSRDRFEFVSLFVRFAVVFYPHFLFKHFRAGIATAIYLNTRSTFYYVCALHKPENQHSWYQFSTEDITLPISFFPNISCFFHRHTHTHTYITQHTFTSPKSSFFPSLQNIFGELFNLCNLYTDRFIFDPPHIIAPAYVIAIGGFPFSYIFACLMFARSLCGYTHNERCTGFHTFWMHTFRSSSKNVNIHVDARLYLSIARFFA